MADLSEQNEIKDLKKQDETKTFPKKSIPKKQYEDLKSAIMGNIYGLNFVAREFLKKEKTQKLKGKYIINPAILQVCAALHSHAVEEYGKYFIIDELKQNKKGKYDLFKIKKKFFDHEEKFRKAANLLPDSCLDLGFDFISGGEIKPELTSRADIFYVGIDEDGFVRSLPEIDFNKLDTALEDFQTEFYDILKI